MPAMEEGEALMEENNRPIEGNDDLKKFGMEIAEIARKEAEGGETADFSGMTVQPEEFTESDMGIWEKLQDETLTLQEFKEYRKSFDGFGNDTRERFLYYVANRLNALIHNEKENR